MPVRVSNLGKVPDRVTEHVTQIWGWLRMTVLNRVEWEYNRTLPLMSETEIQAVTDMTVVRTLAGHLRDHSGCWSDGSGLPQTNSAAVLTRLVKRTPAWALILPVLLDCEAAERAGHRLNTGGTYPKPRYHPPKALLEVGAGVTDEWRDRMLRKKATGQL